MRRKSTAAILALTGLLLVTSTTYADVKLPAIFGDHMVLQQKENVAVWGWADPGEEISVKGSWKPSKKTTKANADGKWKVEIRTPKAGKTGTLTITGNNEIVLNDILFGEVWICSGQSNMQWSLQMLNTETAKQDIAKAALPEIRLFTVQKAFSETPKDNVKGSWQICSPETVAPFSATGYYFGKKLHENLGVPIGLISTNWGGTKAEAWTSAETIKEFRQFDGAMETIQNPDKRTEQFKMHKNQPTVLYNAMLAPLIPFRIAGAVWYQGESNCYDPIGYRTLFPAMITDWRDKWGQGDFPFYFVQIAPFEYGPNRGHSQALREAQMMTLDAVDNVGMAVTMDIGEEKDIHPRNKHDVGDRLARWALAKTYGYGINRMPYSGPIYYRMRIADGKIILDFKNADGMVAKNGKLTDFMIAGKDRKFVPAKAEIHEHSERHGRSMIVAEWIEVWSEEVPEPVAVRYGWSNWVMGSLFNKTGLPASSFRTDDWPLE